MKWLVLTGIAVATYLVLNGLIWVYAGWDAQQPGADSVGPEIFLVPLLAVPAVLSGFLEGYRGAPWQSVATRWAVVSGALCVANAVYDQGSWLSDPDSWVLATAAWTALIYGPLLVGGAAVGRTVGLDVRERRTGDRHSTERLESI